MAEWLVNGCAGSPVGVFAGIVLGFLILRAADQVRRRKGAHRG